jgi:hypothetical protein
MPSFRVRRGCVRTAAALMGTGQKQFCPPLLLFPSPTSGTTGAVGYGADLSSASAALYPPRQQWAEVPQSGVLPAAALAATATAASSGAWAAAQSFTNEYLAPVYPLSHGAMGGAGPDAGLQSPGTMAGTAAAAAAAAVAATAAAAVPPSGAGGQWAPWSEAVVPPTSSAAGRAATGLVDAYDTQVPLTVVGGLASGGGGLWPPGVSAPPVAASPSAQLLSSPVQLGRTVAAAGVGGPAVVAAPDAPGADAFGLDSFDEEEVDSLLGWTRGLQSGGKQC